MKACALCRNKSQCRVPRDMLRFDTVAHRLEGEDRNPLLRQRLRYYVDTSECLVEAGFARL